MTSSQDPPASPVIVYHRPGCPFCSSLLRRLTRSGLEHTRVDIWQDPEAAAEVRAVAGGNETVPTVKVGPRTLVNPTARQVLELVAEQAPDWLPPPPEPRGWWRRSARATEG